MHFKSKSLVKYQTNVLKGVNEARFEAHLKARRHQNAPRRLPKDVGHGRRMPSYPRLLKGVKAYAFFASRGKRARVDGRLREKEEKDERPEEKEEKEK